MWACFLQAAKCNDEKKGDKYNQDIDAQREKILFGTDSAMNIIASATLDIASEPIRKSDSGSITIDSAANKR